MLTEDYLMRYIRIAVAALAKMVGLKAAGLDQDALFLLDRSLEQILGLRIDLIRSLDTRDLFKLLADQERLDPGLLAVLGDLFAEEADLLGRLDRPVDSVTSAVHALALYLESALSGPDPNNPVGEKIEALLTWLDCDQIPDETWFALFNYYDTISDPGGACDALERLLQRVGLQPDLVDLARDFYTRLLEHTDPELERANISRADVLANLSRLEGAW